MRGDVFVEPINKTHREVFRVISGLAEPYQTRLRRQCSPPPGGGLEIKSPDLDQS